MKRIVAMLAVLALGIGVAAWAIGNEDGDDYPGMMGPGHRSGQMGPGMMGPGMMGGGMMGGSMMGPGMMGGGMMGGGMMGMGMMGGGMMRPMWQSGDLSDEEFQQLSELHWNAMRSMHANMPQHWRRMGDLREAMSEFPLDTERVMAAWEAAQEDHAAMFQMHLQVMRQAQEVLGQERWEEMMERRGGMGHGRMGGGGMMGGGRRGGPGMMDR